MAQNFLPSIPFLSIHHSPSRLEQVSPVPVCSAFTCLVLIQSVSDIIPFSCMGYSPASLLLAPSSFPLQPHWPSSQLSSSPFSLVQQFFSKSPTSTAFFCKYQYLSSVGYQNPPWLLRKQSKKILFCCCSCISDHAWFRQNH